jgi:IrrE N-terminal-like domain
MMKAEQRVASLIAVRHGLEPPVDIRAIVKLFADIEEDSIPAKCDAVLVPANKKRSRPLIVLDEGKSEIRKRFTLAHELGHLKIPWHTPIIAGCHVFEGVSRFYYQTGEGEANRFASELLMPSGWLQRIVVSGDSIIDMLRTVYTAEVSVPAACLALCQNLPSGYVFAQIDDAGIVTLSGASPGSAVRAPDRGEHLEVKEFGRGISQSTEISSRSTKVYWWKFQATDLPQDPADNRSASEILSEILGSLGLDAEKRQTLRQQVNGVIGAANSTYKTGSSCSVSILDAKRPCRNLRIRR